MASIERGRDTFRSGFGISSGHRNRCFVSQCSFALSASALIKLVCFAEPKPDGEYFTEADCRYLYSIAPNLQGAFEALNKAMVEAREEIKNKIKKAEADSSGRDVS